MGRISIVVSNPIRCWNWIGLKSNTGYGLVQLFRGKQVAAHRWMFGPVEEGKELHHICENRACINPDHLVEVTDKEHRLLHGFSGSPAVNKEKTHCVNGHPFDEKHTYYFRGHRSCRTCNTEATKRYQRRKKMPLIKSGSKRARSKNIAEMVRAGHPVKQAVAASYSNQRKYRKGKRGNRKSR